MTDHLALDLVRFAHFIGLALGLGLALFADLRFLGNLVRRLVPDDMALIERLHVTVARALIVMWVSGIALLYLRTGFELAAFTPKLQAKLVVVTILTLNAILISRLALPVMHRAVGYPICDIRFTYRLRLMLIGAISTGSWASGLILGVFSDLKPLALDTLIGIIGPVYVLCLSGAVLLAFVAPGLRYIVLRQRNSQGEDPYARVRARYVPAE